MTFRIDTAIADLNPRVIPIKGDKKGPTIPNWPNTDDTVETWLQKNGGDHQFDEEEFHRYGVVIDADMLVVDVDVHDGQANGYESLHRLMEDGGPDLLEQAGLVVLSPSGGRHLFFKKDPDKKFPGNSKAYPALDFLSLGKQVIGAGSNHVNGGVYTVEKWTGELTEVDYDLLNFIAPPKQATEAPVTSSATNTGDTPRDSFDRSRSGMEALRSAMESVGYVFTRKGEEYEYVRPDKTDFTHSISGTLGRVDTKGKPYLRNFSTSDLRLGAESYSFSEALKRVLGLDNAGLMSELDTLGFGRKVEDIRKDPLIAEFLRSMTKKPASVKQTGEEIEKSYPTMTFDELVSKTAGGTRRPWIIKNLLRRGEVMNVIAAPKVGKSWLVYNLALAMSCGEKFIGYQSSKNLKVLICDNELHQEELAYRVKAVAGALNVNPSDRLQFTTLRGSDVDVNDLDSKLDEIGGSRFDIIVIDALYRILPKGISENDNAGMTQLYNKLDSIARKNEAAMICVHHSSKGNQGDKDVTDVGAGAGSISRAADTHLTIRQHLEDGLFVIEAVTRSGISPEPVVATLNWPRWEIVEGEETTLRNFENARDKKNKEAKDESDAKEEMIVEWIVTQTKAGKQVTGREAYEMLKLSTWPNVKTFKKHLKILSESGQLKLIPSGAGRENYYIASE